ncbi:hypothetical protein DFQ28_004184 [Apophysomyces sp. BC1034]|nr:hypothetical protein DFQ30_005995 [Apophysomyces sp. BC1015]KAG0177603.1 hypothetical protein DFQ29_004655 [Apophysomyces sp. BC1021]KAG0188906.1 hypothetical protein DFQ28_004184 [Apophysomyces sp. BC1034]
MSSVDNVAVDLARLSFDTPDSAYLLSKPLLNEPSITVTKDKAPRSRNRNRQCVPSDDEDDDEEEEEEEEESSDDEKTSVPRGHLQQRRASGISTPSKPTRKTQPLPSDDEDSDDDDNEEIENDKKPMYQIQGTGSNSQIHRSAQRPGYQHQDSPAGSFVAPISATEDDSQYNNAQDDDDDNEVLGQHMRGPALLGLPEGSHLQQLQQMQQYHQAQLAQFQYQQQQQPHPSKSSSSHLLRPHSPHQRVSMSGMDLLKQLEQEKADAKRQKPKLNTSNVKIEGLLAKLPEPGSHNISFQQLQQQGMKRKSQRPVSTHGYLDMPNNYQRPPSSSGTTGDRRSHVPSGYGYPNDYAGANPAYRTSTPGSQPVYPYPYQQQQQQQQYMSLGNTATSGSMAVPRGDIPSRPGSALSQHDIPLRRSADSHTP